MQERMLAARSTGRKQRRPNEQVKRVNVDFPAWVVAGLDGQARHLGVTRQALIKLWIAERLQRSGSPS